jgi:hypothetical protein
MNIRLTLLIECFCDQCGVGQLHPLLNAGFNSKKTAISMQGEKIKCEKCGHENEIEKVYTMIPNEFLWFGTDNYEKIKSDQSVKKFLSEDDDGSNG